MSTSIQRRISIVANFAETTSDGSSVGRLPCVGSNPRQIPTNVIPSIVHTRGNRTGNVHRVGRKRTSHFDRRICRGFREILKEFRVQNQSVLHLLYLEMAEIIGKLRRLSRCSRWTFYERHIKPGVRNHVHRVLISSRRSYWASIMSTRRALIAPGSTSGSPLNRSPMACSLRLDARACYSKHTRL